MLLRPPSQDLLPMPLQSCFSRETLEKLLESLKMWMSANGSHHTRSLPSQQGPELKVPPHTLPLLIARR